MPDFIWSSRRYANHPDVAEGFGREPRYQVMKRWMMRLVAPFNKLARESIEMMYPYEKEYLFDSSKFANRFFAATPYRQGIERTLSAG